MPPCFLQPTWECLIDFPLTGNLSLCHCHTNEYLWINNNANFNYLHKRVAGRIYHPHHHHRLHRPLLNFLPHRSGHQVYQSIHCRSLWLQYTAGSLVKLSDTNIKTTFLRQKQLCEKDVLSSKQMVLPNPREHLDTFAQYCINSGWDENLLVSPCTSPKLCVGSPKLIYSIKTIKFIYWEKYMLINNVEHRTTNSTVLNI